MVARTERTPIDTPRCAVLVGPYLSGKTSLMESLLAACGAIPRQGSVKDGRCCASGERAPPRGASYFLCKERISVPLSLGPLGRLPHEVFHEAQVLGGLLALELVVRLARTLDGGAHLLGPLADDVLDQRARRLRSIGVLPLEGDEDERTVT